ncbi:hypothetical protein T4D_5777 [Trichinella pseudospiralis]|uniref:Uncharacterized protein n=1 Tax=Trichinella pseudospiralis TaxID=6337 RepID=A0A0V1FP70_TRIPS|nr:hypothetical protein T4D_5777 [Trichinella pseudospiralis]
MAIFHKVMAVDGIGSLVGLFGIKRILNLRSDWNQTGKVETEPAPVTSHLKMNDRFIGAVLENVLFPHRCRA